MPGFPAQAPLTLNGSAFKRNDSVAGEVAAALFTPGSSAQGTSERRDPGVLLGGFLLTGNHVNSMQSILFCPAGCLFVLCGQCTSSTELCNQEGASWSTGKGDARSKFLPRSPSPQWGGTWVAQARLGSIPNTTNTTRKRDTNPPA